MLMADARVTDELFTYVSEDRTKVIHFNPSALSRDIDALLRSGEARGITFALLKPDIEYIVANRGVDLTKLSRISEPYLSMPVLGVEMGDGSVLTIDGHHRMVRLFGDGRTECGMYLVPLPVAMRYAIEDLPTAFSAYLISSTLSQFR